MSTRPLVALLLFVAVSLSHTTIQADWPEFRGPFGNGYVSGPGSRPVGLPITWTEKENIRWKTPISYRGWSTPVLMGGQVWLTTATEDGHDFFAICVDENTGEILHNKKLFHSDDPEPLGNNTNFYASPSPAIEPGRVYVHFGSYGTACLSTATGEVLWQRNDLKCRHYRGPSSSVVLFENLVILTLDGVDLQYVIALDKQTGKTVWKTDRDVKWQDQNIVSNDPEVAKRIQDGDMRKAHSTPLIITLPDGRPQMLSGGAMSAFAYNPRNGKEDWRITFDDFSVISRPVYENGIAYMVTGNIHAEMWAIRTGSSGDLTNTDNILWRLKSRVAHTASPILLDGLIYMATDDGVLNCVDAATSKTVWQKRVGGSFNASPIYGDGRIYCCNREGETTVIKPGRKFEALATNTLDEGCMASPAVDGRALFLRTKTHLYRIESSASASE